MSRAVISSPDCASPDAGFRTPGAASLCPFQFEHGFPLRVSTPLKSMQACRLADQQVPLHKIAVLYDVRSSNLLRDSLAHRGRWLVVLW
jgi:hypothetical protein